MNMSGGLQRIKGQSPKMQAKDAVAGQRRVKYQMNPAMVGGMSNIGNQVPVPQGYVVRNIQSSKGMNRSQNNNLMMSQ